MFLYKGLMIDFVMDWFLKYYIDLFCLVLVDVGYMVELMFRDLGAVACNLAFGGVIVVDDFFYLYWIGVIEGLF